MWAESSGDKKSWFDSPITRTVLRSAERQLTAQKPNQPHDPGMSAPAPATTPTSTEPSSSSPPAGTAGFAPAPSGRGAASSVPPTPPPLRPAALAENYIPGQGACVSAHPIATLACLTVLESGGSAFDAAVATSATLAVTEPFGSGLGGGGFFLLHQASNRRNVFLDGRERAPANLRAEMFKDATGKVDNSRLRTGMLAAAIPHQAALIAHLANHYGSRKLGLLLAPAIAAAEQGFTVDQRLAGEIAAHYPRMDAETQRLFGYKGKPLKAGALLVQAELAATLRRFAANGASEFATGLTAQRQLAGVALGGGVWQASDLAQIAITERQPLVGQYRAYTVVTAPPPSLGGLAILQTLGQLDALGYRGLASENGPHQVIEAFRRAYRDRNRYGGDGDVVAVPTARLLAPPYLAELARSIGEQATPSAQLPAPGPVPEGPQTTHFAVLDAAGNRVAGTQSLNLFFGAAVSAPGTGVVLNDTIDDFSASLNSSNSYGLPGSAANAIAPGKRPVSSMSPTFVTGPNGLLITGTPGGSRIPTMVTLSVLRFTEGANAAQISGGGRFHHQWQPDGVQFEPGALSPQQQAELSRRGHSLSPLKERYGNLQVITYQPAGCQLDAAADPRWLGYAALTSPSQNPASPLPCAAHSLTH